MLVLSRKIGEAIYIGNDIKITIIEVNPHGWKVRVGIDAPREVTILREELWEPPLTPVET